MAICRARRRVLGLLAAGPALAAWPASAREGVDVGAPSVFSQVVSAEQIERAATGQYLGLLRQSAQQRNLAPPEHPQVRRLRAIAERIIPHTFAWNERARQWRWEAVSYTHLTLPTKRIV